VRGHPRYGVQFSSSRAYVSTPLYAEFEELLEKIFGSAVVVTQTTSLGHLAALPVIVATHAVLYDVLVHASRAGVLPRCARPACLPTAAAQCVDRLHEALTELSGRHDKIWYLCDGIYSMHGDRARSPSWLALSAQHPSCTCT